MLLALHFPLKRLVLPMACSAPRRAQPRAGVPVPFPPVQATSILQVPEGKYTWNINPSVGGVYLFFLAPNHSILASQRSRSGTGETSIWHKEAHAQVTQHWIRHPQSCCQALPPEATSPGQTRFAQISVSWESRVGEDHLGNPDQPPVTGQWNYIGT